MGFRICFRLLLLDSICNLLQMPMPFPSKLGPPRQMVGGNISINWRGGMGDVTGVIHVYPLSCLRPLVEATRTK